MDLDFCVTTSATWRLIGYILYALKVVIPVIIIILGTIDFVKALIASDDNINKAAKSLLMRFVIGLIVFFVPLLVSTFLHLVKDAIPFLEKADACQSCLLRPFNSSCTKAVKEVQKYNEDQKNESLNDNDDFLTARYGCYKCDGKYVWSTGGCGAKVINLDSPYTKETCEAENDNPVNQVEQNIIERPGSNGSSHTDVIYLGDSIMNGMCIYKNLNKSAGCYFGKGKNIEWLKGNSTQMGDAINSGNPVPEITKIIKNNPSKKYAIVILMGTNDIATGANTTTLANNYASLYSKLAQGDWKTAQLQIVAVNPVGDDVVSHGYSSYLSNTRINNFNTTLSKNISNMRLANVKYCNTGIKQSDLDYFDGLHFGNNGRAKLFNTIQEKCLK